MLLLGFRRNNMSTEAKYTRSAYVGHEEINRRQVLTERDFYYKAHDIGLSQPVVVYPVGYHRSRCYGLLILRLLLQTLPFRETVHRSFRPRHLSIYCNTGDRELVVLN